MGKRPDNGLDLRSGQVVKNGKTGQLGEVSRHRSTFTRWAIMVHVLKPTGGRSSKTVVWKVKDLELV